MTDQLFDGSDVWDDDWWRSIDVLISSGLTWLVSSAAERTLSVRSRSRVLPSSQSGESTADVRRWEVAADSAESNYLIVTRDWCPSSLPPSVSGPSRMVTDCPRTGCRPTQNCFSLHQRIFCRLITILGTPHGCSRATQGVTGCPVCLDAGRVR